MRSRAVLGRLAACAAAVVVLMGAGAVSASASAPGKAHLSSGTNNQANSSGSATKVKRKDGGGALLTSTNYGYGSIAVHIPSPVTMNALTALNTDFEVNEGTCSGGSPRFAVVVRPPEARGSANDQTLLVYFGTQPYGGCASQVSQTTDATQADWWTGYGEKTFAQTLSLYDSWRLIAVEVDVDGGWDQSPDVQQVLIQNLTVGIDGTNKTYYRSSP
jgi:hypothetical protein